MMATKKAIANTISPRFFRILADLYPKLEKDEFIAESVEFFSNNILSIILSVGIMLKLTKSTTNVKNS